MVLAARLGVVFAALYGGLLLCFSPGVVCALLQQKSPPPTTATRRRRFLPGLLRRRSQATAVSFEEEADHGGGWSVGLNSALERAALPTLCAFVVVDVGSALALLRLLGALNVQVPVEFGVAYAISKGLLRAPRLALDALLAASLAKRWPELARVRLTLILDAAANLTPRAALTNVKEQFTPRAALTTVAPSSKKSSNKSLDDENSSSSSSVVRQARVLLDRYGLAYMAAKNIIGPLCTLVLYYALLLSSRKGSSGFFQRALRGTAASNVGGVAGRLALASTASTLLFPFVIWAAAKIGPAVDAAARRSFCQRTTANGGQAERVK